MLLLRHTEYAAYGLNGKLVARQFAEDEKHGSSRTIPTKCDGFLEQQNFSHVVVLL